MKISCWLYQWFLLFVLQDPYSFIRKCMLLYKSSLSLSHKVLEMEMSYSFQNLIFQCTLENGNVFLLLLIPFCFRFWLIIIINPFLFYIYLYSYYLHSYILYSYWLEFWNNYYYIFTSFSVLFIIHTCLCLLFLLSFFSSVLIIIFWWSYDWFLWWHWTLAWAWALVRHGLKHGQLHKKSWEMPQEPIMKTRKCSGLSLW